MFSFCSIRTNHPVKNAKLGRVAKPQQERPPFYAIRMVVSITRDAPHKGTDVGLHLQKLVERAFEDTGKSARLKNSMPYPTQRHRRNSARPKVRNGKGNALPAGGGRWRRFTL